MKSQHSSHTHLQATQIRAQTKACKRVCLSNRTADSKPDYRKEQRRHNSTYKKLAVQWLNEVLCFVSSFVVADSFVLRHRQLLVAANRYNQFQKK
jgi:hypothetical protein